MQASGLPHTPETVEELFNLVDIHGTGIMGWSDFESFVANEIQEGQDFMEGEFVLPSGTGIQFAAMVDILRRKSRLQAVMKVRSSCALAELFDPMARLLLCSCKMCDV